jgi:hypothetical protein
MIRKFLFSVAILSLVASCKNETTFKEVKVNDRYSISIPEYLQPCVDLHKDASFQYQNADKDIYAIVIDERKKTMANHDLDYDIDLYFKSIAAEPFLETIKEGKVSTPTAQNINGNKALVGEITGKIDQTPIYYKLGVVETSSSFYQIITWTRQDNKEQMESDMTHMIDSFKELPQVENEAPHPAVNTDSIKNSAP